MNTTANTETHTVTAINRGLGTIEIHKQGCKDLKRNARGASIWNIEAASQKDVASDVFEDHIAEELAPELGGFGWKEYNVELTYMNCCPDLPYGDDEEAPAEAPAQAKGRTDQESLIMNYLEGHRGVNYTPHTLAKAIGHRGLRDALARLAAAGKIDQVGNGPVCYVLRVHPLPAGE